MNGAASGRLASVWRSTERRTLALKFRRRQEFREDDQELFLLQPENWFACDRHSQFGKSKNVFFVLLEDIFLLDFLMDLFQVAGLGFIVICCVLGPDAKAKDDEMFYFISACFAAFNIVKGLILIVGIVMVSYVYRINLYSSCLMFSVIKKNFAYVLYFLYRVNIISF